MRTTGKLCRELNVKPYQVEYLIRNMLIPEPQKTDSGHRLFSDEDVERVKEKLLDIKTRAR